MSCKLCQSESKLLFKKKILNKYEVGFHQCVNCNFVQTDEPFWLEESYQSAITSLDLGYVSRNIQASYFTSTIIDLFFDTKSKFVDYGGGYGLFVRLMRDKGFDFYIEDKYCQNLFANNFEILTQNDEKFELLTAFEVFEHLSDPKEEIEKMLVLSRNILFTTSVPPKDNIENWWYLLPEIGQHVSFYSLKSLEETAKKYNLNLYSDGKILHLLTEKKLNQKVFKFYSKQKNAYYFQLIFKRNRNSLLKSDFEKTRFKTIN